MRLEVHNFGPIEEANIELAPIVIFIGKNESGKTYLSLLLKSFISAIQRIMFIDHKNLQTYFERIGKFIKLEDRIVLEGQDLQRLAMELSRLLKNAFLKMLRRYFLANIIDLININSDESRIIFDGSKGSFELKLSRNKKEIRKKQKVASLRFKFNVLEILIDLKEVISHVDSAEYPLFMRGYRIYTSYSIEENKVVLRTRVDILGKLTSYSEGDIRLAIIRDIVSTLFRAIFDIPPRTFYIPSSRAGIIEFIDVINRGLIFSEVIRVPYYLRETISILREYLETADIIPQDLKTKVIEMNRELYAGTFEVVKIKGRKILSYKIDNISIPIHLVSSMVKETYPLLIHIPFISRGSLLIIEEPEAHLHPENLLKLAQQFIRLIKERLCYIMISTHSDVLLQAIAIELMRQAIDEGTEIPAKFYLFKMKEKGKTITKEIGFSLESGLDETLADVYEELYSEFTRLRTKYLKRKYEKTTSK